MRRFPHTQVVAGERSGAIEWILALWHAVTVWCMQQGLTSFPCGPVLREVQLCICILSKSYVVAMASCSLFKEMCIEHMSSQLTFKHFEGRTLMHGLSFAVYCTSVAGKTLLVTCDRGTQARHTWWLPSSFCSCVSLSLRAPVE
jgi:hypothetical protein